jgi:hypothetical protein
LSLVQYRAQSPLISSSGVSFDRHH